MQPERSTARVTAMTPNPRYKTDFNDIDDNGLVTTLPSWGGSILVPTADDIIDLFDGDENTCIGIVERVEVKSGLIYVKPLWDSWRDGVQSTLPSPDDALIQSAIHVVESKQQTGTTDRLEPEPGRVSSAALRRG